MIYKWNNFTKEKDIDYTAKLDESLNSDYQCADVYLTSKGFIGSPLYNEINFILSAKSYYLISLKFPTISFTKFCKFVSYIYLYLYGVEVHIDNPIQEFPWYLVYYNNETPASAFKLIERKYISAILIAIPNKQIDDNRYMTSLNFDRIKARITGALYDAEIYKEYNSADDPGMQSKVPVLL